MAGRAMSGGCYDFCGAPVDLPVNKPLGLVVVAHGWAFFAGDVLAEKFTDLYLVELLGGGFGVGCVDQVAHLVAPFGVLGGYYYLY